MKNLKNKFLKCFIERCKAILNKPLKNVFDLYNKFYIFECLNDYSHEF